MTEPHHKHLAEMRALLAESHDAQSQDPQCGWISINGTDEWRVSMGPITIMVGLNHDAGCWFHSSVINTPEGALHVSIDECKAEAVSAVERWRDSIRVGAPEWIEWHAARPGVGVEESKP